MHYHTAKANATEQRDLRKDLRNNLTPAEAALWRGLSSRRADGLKFRRQQGIGPYVLDFYCPEVRLCVELDGSSHDHKYDYDERRTAFLAEQGITVIRFSNDQIWTNLPGVLSEIIRVARAIKAAALSSTPNTENTPPTHIAENAPAVATPLPCRGGVRGGVSNPPATNPSSSDNFNSNNTDPTPNPSPTREGSGYRRSQQLDVSHTQPTHHTHAQPTHDTHAQPAHDTHAHDTHAQPLHTPRIPKSLIILLLLLLTACATDETTDTAEDKQPKAVAFAVASQTWQDEVVAVTRSGETLDAIMSSTDGFMAFSTLISASEPRHVVWDDEKSQWSYGSPILWSDNQVQAGVTGFAYWPTKGNATLDAKTDGTGLGISISFDATNGTITFTPGGLDSQTDLLWARASNANDETTIGTDGTINLDFRHALAQLSFGHITNDYGQDITLQRVTVSGTPYQSGVLDLSYGDGKDGTWTTLTPYATEQTKTYGSLSLSVPNGQSKNLGLDPILQLPGPTLTVTFAFDIGGQTESVTTSVTLQQGVDKRVNMTVDRNHEVVITN